LDGTLLNDERMISAQDWQTLARLRDMKVLRVVATGRSLWSARQAIPLDLPIDALVFSSGAGVVTWPDGDLTATANLTSDDLAVAIGQLKEVSCDFMVQHGAPDSHVFHHLRTSGVPNPDFDRRIARYDRYATALESDPPSSAAHLVAIHPLAGGVEMWRRLKACLPAFNVVRTTSPIDGESVWIEVFPAGVSKASACAALAAERNIPRDAVMAVGNDYNDLDLLEWAGNSFVVANAPAPLRQRFASVASHRDSGVSDAVCRWLGEGDPSIL
ncbi:MAG: HAD family phosphatase, partial [Chromatiales bacterium]|nr:HAD family phosphatase [Chromatiales bacterium]